MIESRLYDPMGKGLSNGFSASRSRNRPPIEAMITIGIDDCFMTDYTKAYPIFSSRGMSATSFCVLDYIGTQNRLGWDEIQEMYANGWDFQCHSKVHLGGHNGWLGLDNATIEEHLEEVNTAWQAHGLPIPIHHTPPGFNVDERVKSVLSKYRVSYRIDGGLSRNPTMTKDFMGYYCANADIQTEERFEQIKGAIDLAILEKSFLALYMHTVLDEPGSYQYAIKTYYLEKLLDYIEEAGIRIETISNLYNQVMEWRNWEG